jgi:hypothetical protein
MRYVALGWCGKASSVKRYIKKFDCKRWNMCAVPHVFCGHRGRIHMVELPADDLDRIAFPKRRETRSP